MKRHLAPVFRRRFPQIMTLMLCIGLVGYCGYWFWAMSQMRDSVEGWIASWRHSGFLIQHGDIRNSGFPFDLHVSVETPRIEDPGRTYNWQVEQVVLKSHPWEPLEYGLWLNGWQKGVVPVDGRLIDLNLMTDSAEGWARFGLDGALRQARVVIAGLKGRSEALDDTLGVDGLTVTLELPATPPEPGAPGAEMGESANLQLIGAGLNLPARYAGPLGPKLKRISSRLHLLGPVPRRDLRQALSIWRDAGGTLDVRWLRTEWGPLGLKAEGTMALDRDLRPIAAFQTKVSGLTATFEKLAENGLVDPQVARVAGLGLELFATTPPEGGAPEVPVPFSIQEGEVYLGPLKVAEVRPVLPPLGRIEAMPPIPDTSPTQPPGAVTVEPLDP